MITVVDYQMGNVGSIVNRLKRLGATVCCSGNPDDIRRADKIVLPGVGSFAQGMAHLERLGLIPALTEKVVEGQTPFLGICLGMQLLARRSEEGDCPGLGWIEGHCQRFNFSEEDSRRVPHVGWDNMVMCKDAAVLGEKFPGGRFYFTHSYHMVCDDPSDVCAYTSYGRDFVSAVARDNILGVQCHPERSHADGITLFKHFLNPERSESESVRGADVRSSIRVFPCLLLKGRGLVKTVRFKKETYIGDPVNAVRIFNTKEVDELLLLDIKATAENRGPDIDLITQITDECAMPVTYGGGIRSLDDAIRVIQCGVEKIALNAAAVRNPGLINEVASHFGRQSVVAVMDVKRHWTGRYDVSPNGSGATGKNPVRHAQALAEAGAGEILINSIDREGTMEGLDTGLIRAISDAVTIPVIACGGAGNLAHIAEAAFMGGASAVAAGSMFVYHGPRRAVLINFPTPEELSRALDPMEPQCEEVKA